MASNVAQVNLTHKKITNQYIVVSMHNYVIYTVCVAHKKNRVERTTFSGGGKNENKTKEEKHKKSNNCIFFNQDNP